MAVGVVLDFPGATLDQYDRVIEKMGLVRGGPMPEGGICHWVTVTDDGIRVTDLWETREQFEKFAAEQIGPYTREVGITEPPSVSFHEAHNYLLKTESAVPA
jgi:hypothetical protein